MESLKVRLSNFLEILTPIREELTLFAAVFLVSILIYCLVVRGLNRKQPDEIGMRIVEEFGGQTLVSIRNPGNIRTISKKIQIAQNVMIRFAKMGSSEFDYAVSLLKELGEMRGVPVIKVDEGLFLVRGAAANRAILKRGTNWAQIVDFQGDGVPPN
jgi:hypothetical protein